MLNPAIGLLLILGGVQSEPPVNLLELIDVKKDAVKGAWNLSPKGLVSPGQRFSRIMIPYAPPEEYDLTIVAERHGKSNSLNLGLAVGDVQFLVILDGYFNNSGYVSGLEMIGGRPFFSNESTTKGAIFEDGKRTQVVCSVRKGRVTVTAGGKKVFDWKEDFKRLSLHPGWAVPRKDCLLVGSWTSVVRIEKLELKAVTGTGRKLRGRGPAPKRGPTAIELRTLVDRLDSPKSKERNSAEEALSALPVDRLPEIRKLVREKGGVEARLRVDALALPAPWPKLLGGTIREAHETLRKLRDPESEGRRARDEALAGLLKLPAKEARALTETLVVWMGEFGRTPRINPNSGRDHWTGRLPRASGASRGVATLRPARVSMMSMVTAVVAAMVSTVMPIKVAPVGMVAEKVAGIMAPVAVKGGGVRERGVIRTRVGVVVVRRRVHPRPDRAVVRNIGRSRRIGPGRRRRRRGLGRGGFEDMVDHRLAHLGLLELGDVGGRELEFRIPRLQEHDDDFIADSGLGQLDDVLLGHVTSRCGHGADRQGHDDPECVLHDFLLFFQANYLSSLRATASRSGGGAFSSNSSSPSSRRWYTFRPNLKKSAGLNT